MDDVLMLGGEKEDVGEKRGMCGIFAGRSQTGAAQGNSRWELVGHPMCRDRIGHLRRACCFVTSSYAQRPRVCAAAALNDGSVAGAQGLCFACAFCRCDLHRKEDGDRGQSASRRASVRGRNEKRPKQQITQRRTSRSVQGMVSVLIRATVSCLSFGRLQTLARTRRPLNSHLRSRKAGRAKDGGVRTVRASE